MTGQLELPLPRPPCPRCGHAEGSHEPSAVTTPAMFLCRRSGRGRGCQAVPAAIVQVRACRDCEGRPGSPGGPCSKAHAFLGRLEEERAGEEPRP